MRGFVQWRSPIGRIIGHAMASAMALPPDACNAGGRAATAYCTAYCTTWASLPDLYCSAISFSAIGLILPAWPSQPNAT